MKPLHLFTLLTILFLSLNLTGCFSDDDEAKPESVQSATPAEAVVESVVEAARDTEGRLNQSASGEAVDYSRPEAQGDIRVLDISERSYDGGGALAVTFSEPVDASKKIGEYFEVSKNGEAISGGWVLSKSEKVAYFQPTEPKETYEIRVLAGLPAKAGDTLKGVSEKMVKTRNVVPMVNFATNDRFLPLNAQTGLPITTINTPEIDVNFYRINSDELDHLNRFINNQKVNRYYLRNVKTWAAHKHFARYTLDTPPNKRRNMNLPIQNIESLQEPGVYLAVMSQAGEFYGDVHATFFAVTDIGLHARFYGNKMNVYANSLSTTKPMSDVEMLLLNDKGAILERQRSDEKGTASFSDHSKNRPAVLVAKKGKSTSFFRVKEPAIDLSEFEVNMRPYRPLEFFVYAPRDLYRPGEVVLFSGLLRNFDGRIERSIPLKSKIKDARGKTVKNFSWSGNRQGYYEYEFALPSNAATGNWTLEVKNTDGSLINYDFKVEEFMPERLKVEFEGEAFQSGSQITTKVKSEYLYGAPASNNRLTSEVSVSSIQHPVESLKDFYFGNAKKIINERFSMDTQYLNAEGEAQIAVDNRWKQAETPVAMNIYASVYESGGRAVTRGFRAIVLPSNKMMGIRPGFKKDENPRQNSQVSFELVYADKDGNKLAASDVKTRLVREDRSYFWEYSDRQGWHYEFTEQEYEERSQTVSIAKGKTSRITVPVEYGYYRLEVKDPNTGYVSSIRFYAGYNWYEDWRNNQYAGDSARPDKVSLAFDKGGYKAGDNAVLSIVPPEAGESLILVESDKLLWQKRVSVPKEGKKVKIPISRRWNRHDIYVSVIHLQPTQKKKNITAQRAVGLIHLPLDRETQRLNVSIEAPEKAKPNRQQMVKVKVEGAKRAYVTLAAVDVGVLNITRFKTPEPFNYFFEPRRYQVDMRDIYQRLIAVNDNALAKQRFGGDMMADELQAAELARGGKNAQAEVKVVSLFSGMVNVNAQGYAEIPLELPDFNGRVRLMAVAFSDNAFGHAEQNMTIAAPLVTQIAMPRFMAMGDNSTFALDLHNMTETMQSIRVDMKADGPIVLKEKPSELQLKPNEKTTLLYPVSAGYEVGRTSVKLSVKGVKDYAIDREWGIVTRAAYPALMERKTKWLKPEESMTLSTQKMKGLVPSSLEAVLKISNHADLDLQRHLEYLLKYPYGCLEQSISSTYPWIFAHQENLEQLGIKNPSKFNRVESLQHGLERVARLQLNNGGYGLWSAQSSEERWLTAYAGEFLYYARQQGAKVDQVQYDKTLRRLKAYLGQTGRSGYGLPWSDDGNHYRFAYRAYAGYVLALHKKANLSQLRSLAKQYKSAKTKLSLVHLAVALSLQGDKEGADALLAKVGDVDRNFQRYYADYGSPIRDEAIILRLTLEHNLPLNNMAETTTNLAKMVRDNRYLSTQERNALFITGLMLEKSLKDEWNVGVALKDAIDTIQAKGSWAQRYAGKELEQGLSVYNNGKKSVLINVDYQGYSQEPPKPIKSDYFNVKRDYYTIDGDRTDISKLSVGDLVLVGLTVKVGNKRSPDLLVVDMLPAGLELENQNLGDSIKMDKVKIQGKTLASWQRRLNDRLVHEEYRDDRYVAAINAYSDNTYALFYLARAVTPGTYQVPPTLLEDMYRPERRAISKTRKPITIKNR